MAPGPAEAGSVHPAAPACPGEEEQENLVQQALAEDAVERDVTTKALVPPAARARATIISRHPVVTSGSDIGLRVFRTLDPKLLVLHQAPEGQRLDKGGVVLALEGSAEAVLRAERTALNFMQHLCGIATLAATAVAQVQGTTASLLATRKTTPGLRTLERRAAEAGGFIPHRLNLAEAVLIKENHLPFCTSPQAAVRQARDQAPRGTLIQVEIDAPDPLPAVIAAGADMVLLDNFTPRQVKEAVTLAGGRVVLEASGGITLDNLRAYAETGVHRISVGFVTHSAPAADLSLGLAPSEAGHGS